MTKELKDDIYKTLLRISKELSQGNTDVLEKEATEFVNLVRDKRSADKEENESPIKARKTVK